MTRHLHGKLVTGTPQAELPSEDAIATLLQPLPVPGTGGLRPVAQGRDFYSQQTRHHMLYDEALTPEGMPGTEGIPAWAMDTARLMRAHRKLRENNSAFSFDKHEGPKTTSLLEQVRERLTPIFDSIRGKSRVQARAMKIRTMAAGTLEFYNGKGAGTRSEQREAMHLYSKGYNECRNWASTVQFAKHLVELEEEEKEARRFAKMVKDFGKGFDKMKPGEAMPDGKTLPEFKPFKTRLKEQWSMNGPGELENPTTPDRLDMEAVVKKSNRFQKRRMQEEGAVPTKWHRYPLDGKVFGGNVVKGKIKDKGTILVDLSGSMGWEPEAIQALVLELPNVMILGYVGRNNGESGRLVLIGDRGRVASGEKVNSWRCHIGGSNIVDHPALEVLADMPGPRVWVSDGQVTGKHESTGPLLTAMCEEVCERGQIVRVGDITDATRFFKGEYAGAEAYVDYEGDDSMFDPDFDEDDEVDV